MSTASMGKFDKKVNKYEPDAPNSLKKPKKKSNSNLHTLETKTNLEKDRNMKILNYLQKEKDYKAGDKVKSALNTDKMVRDHKKKDEKFKAKNS
jgi:hypothetical protein